MLQEVLQVHAQRNKEETLKRHIDLYMLLRKIARIWLFGLFLLEAACLSYLIYMGGCYTYSDACYSEYDSRIFDCSSACSIEGEFIITMIIFGVFLVYAASGCGNINSVDDLVSQICRNLYELIPATAIVMAGFKLHDDFLSDSDCNGFSAWTNTGLCTMTANSVVNTYLVTAFAFIPLAASLFFNICFLLYAGRTYHRPITAQNRPLLVIAVEAVEDEEN